jgi:hypothetical protein
VEKHIVASAFDPWEIVELRFDKKGKGDVIRKEYYRSRFLLSWRLGG